MKILVVWEYESLQGATTRIFEPIDEWWWEENFFVMVWGNGVRTYLHKSRIQEIEITK